jgi:uncharacterized membrane protein YphA (DoxX/SURF4 family)
MIIVLLVACGLIAMGFLAFFTGGYVMTHGFKSGRYPLPSQRLPTDPSPRGEIVAGVLIMGGLAVAVIGGVLLAAGLVPLVF